MPPRSRQSTHLEADPTEDYTSTAGRSTREPLRLDEVSPHSSLLSSLNSLLTLLHIPLSLSILSLATPTLLLTVLEALLQVRIEDVPDSIRGTWDKRDRTEIATVVVEAVAQVFDGFERSTRVNGRRDGIVEAKGKRREIDIAKIVRGNEAEIAQLVERILVIAQGLGYEVKSWDRESGAEGRTPRDPTTLRLNRTSPPSSTQPPPVPAAELFAPRPLRPSSTLAAPPFGVPVRPHSISSSSSIRSSKSSISNSSTTTKTSFLASPSLNSPNIRPSFAKELERSGTLSPPPRMPGSPRKSSDRRSGFGKDRSSRRDDENHGVGLTGSIPEGDRKKKSTLELMRQMRKGVVGDVEPDRPTSGKTTRAVEGAVQDVFATPRAATTGVEDHGAERHEVRSERRKKDRTTDGGEETQEEIERAGPRSTHESGSGCCEGCGSTLESETSTTVNSRSDPKKPRQNSVDGGRGSTERQRTRRQHREGEVWCKCGETGGEEADESEGEEATSTSESDTPHAQPRAERSRHRRTSRQPLDPIPPRDRKSSKKSTTSDQTPRPSLPPTRSHESALARRVRIVRSPPLSTLPSRLDPGNLSVHGESEIERFEASFAPSSSHDVKSSLSPSKHTAAPSDNASPSPPEPRLPNASTVETPLRSAYTISLLAQKAMLAEKLRALELRERDRSIAAAAARSGRTEEIRHDE